MVESPEQILSPGIRVSSRVAPITGSRPQAYPLIKRFADALVSLTGLIFSSPVWLVIAVAVKLEDGGPVFHRKRCRGLNGRVFDQLKFRSMIQDAEKHTGPVLAKKDDKRITRVGKILRKTAMDELPQLLNILKGEMSFVGPRPQREVLVRDYVQVIQDYDARHQVRPGLTGLAQVYGRYFTPPRQKLRFDLLYVKRMNLLLDAKLMLLSFLITFKAKWDSLERKRL